MTTKTYEIPNGSEFEGTLEGFEKEFISRGGVGKISGTGWLTVWDETSAQIAEEMGCRLHPVTENY